MALQLGRTFSDGIARVLTRTGGVLFVGLLAIQLLAQSSINTVVISVFPPGPAGELEAMLGLTLPVSGTVAGLIFLATVVCSGVYFVVLSRALARPRRELATIPSELYTRRIGRATLSMLIGGIIVAISVMIGTAFLIIPGVFLAICFLFVVFAIGVEDNGVLDALKRSWDLSRGNRLALSLLVILAGAIGIVISVVGTLFDLASSPILAEVITNTLGSVLYVLLYGLIASAYLQLRNDDDDGFDTSRSADPIPGGSPADR